MFKAHFTKKKKHLYLQAQQSSSPLNTSWLKTWSKTHTKILVFLIVLKVISLINSIWAYPKNSYQFVRFHTVHKKIGSRNAHRHHGTLSLEVLDDLRGLPQRPGSSIGACDSNVQHGWIWRLMKCVFHGEILRTTRLMAEIRLTSWGW